jgi:hypothetical protein
VSDMGKVIFSALQLILAVALFCSYYLIERDLSALVIGSMLLIGSKIDYLLFKIDSKN